jgi:hypothetical protein
VKRPNLWQIMAFGFVGFTAPGEVIACSCVPVGTFYTSLDQGDGRDMPANGMYARYEDGAIQGQMELHHDGMPTAFVEEYWPGFTDGTGFRAFWPTPEPAAGDTMQIVLGMNVFSHQVVEPDYSPPVFLSAKLTRNSRGLSGSTCGDSESIAFDIDGYGDSPDEVIFVRTEDVESGRFHWFPGLQWNEVCGGQDPAYFGGSKEIVLVDMAGNESKPILVRSGACGCALGGGDGAYGAIAIMVRLLRRR